MRLLEAWLATPLANAIGWTLLHSLWEGAILAAAVAALLLTTRSPRVRYAMACAAMAVMFAGFCLTFVVVTPEGAQEFSPGRTPAFPRWNVSTDMDGPGPTTTGVAAVAPWLAPFWMAGVCAFYLAHVASWISLFRIRRRGVCCVSDGWRDKFSRLSAQMRVTRPVLLLESCFVNAPMVLGHFRPVILMPVGLFTGLPAGQIEAILLHELAHVRRYDYVVNVLQRLLEGLLFYHPATWWLSRVIRTERENCCDDAAVAVSGNAHEYARALAALEQKRWHGPEPAVAATGGNLVKRIGRLLYPKSPSGALAPLSAAAVLIVTTAAMLTALQAAPSPLSSTATATQKNGDHAEPSPYVSWLNEDVLYIIEDEERAAFERLTTDEERQNFIAQFWLRRDPTPGTPENEFREEHYRRIGYANERFRTASGRQGWRTDRGHMYIVYGPADEIEAHPRGAQRPYGTEVWMYRQVEGIGQNLTVTFIDRTGSGDYGLAPGNPR